MTQQKTKRSDVVATFHRYYGRNPEGDDWRTVEWLTKKSPQEVEILLAKNSPITHGDLWDVYNKKKMDPFSVIEEMGYKRGDFSNDPGFENYWKNKTKDELIEGLKRRKDSDSSGRKITQSTIEENDYNKWVDEQDISDVEKEFLKNLTIDTGKVLTDKEIEQKAKEYEEAARKDIAPYYEDLKKRDMEDLRNQYADIRNRALRYQQQDEKSYKELLDSTRKSLRARGLTFSGISRKQLGNESALNKSNVEGEIPQQRRYNWEDARASWQERARDIGTIAERRYDSDTLYKERDYLNPEGLPDPYKNSLTYKHNSYQPIYLPHKKDSRYGYISGNQADIEKQKERDVQNRKQDRLKTLRYQ